MTELTIPYYLGNDLIDLSSVFNQFKDRDESFLNRVFTREEINIIKSAQDANLTLWSIWAAKEAAFKACQKLKLELRFIPRYFSISKEHLNAFSSLSSPSRLMAKMTYLTLSLPITIYIECSTSQTIHSLAILSSSRKIFNDFQYVVYKTTLKEKPINLANIHHNLTSAELSSIKNDESLLLRWQAKRFLNLYIHRKQYELLRDVFIKDEQEIFGPPYLKSKNNPLLNYQISLSHDGKWLAFALLNLTDLSPL